MTIISIMTIFSFLAIVFMLFRFGVYHLLAWLKPIKNMKLTFVDNNGDHHVRTIDLTHPDATELVDSLLELKKSCKDQGA